MKSPVTATVLCTLALSSAGLTGVKAASAPAGASIEKVTYGGSGCPQSSAKVTLGDDSSSFTMTFERFTTSAGPGIAFPLSRRNCQLNLQIKAPQDFQYSIANVNYKGHITLDESVKAIQTCTVFFQGETHQSTVEKTFEGPLNGDLDAALQFSGDSIVWSPCGGGKNLNVNSAVRVDNSRDRSKRGSVVLDSEEGKVVEQMFEIRWRRCGGGGGAAMPPPLLVQENHHDFL
ncbi:hypothetical protein HK102_001030 [Quaeritorhiza haematococci]|nr:hypothetical protein HK102_001030 [Quaeritorhiza haematococci]